MKLARQTDRIGRYFADWALDQVNGYVGGVTSDITVQTTLDVNIQRAAEQKLAGIALHDPEWELARKQVDLAQARTLA